MKKFLCFLTVFVLALSGAAAYAQPPEEIAVSAKACVLIEAVTGKVLFAKNSETKLPMASTTKIMTTLLTLESGGLDDSFIVDSEAIKVEGSSMGLQEGDAVTKLALCYGMLLPSGNDAANACAIKVGGSYENFSRLMNERAKEIGMTSTCFVTPSGLHAEGHGSSAMDMALLTREAMKNDIFRAICSQEKAKVNFGNPPFDRWLVNTNRLLGLYDGVTGVKTGFTDEAGRCLVSACERNGVKLICVTLNAPSDWEDHSKLYDYGFSKLILKDAGPRERLAVNVVGGTADEVELEAEYPLSYGAMEDDNAEITTRLIASPFLYAPVNKGDAAAVLEIYYNGRYIGEIPLLAKQDVPLYIPAG